MDQVKRTWLSIVTCMLLGSVLVLAGGCASTGTDFSEEGLQQLVLGETTEAEAIEQLGGEPESRVVRSDGSYVAIWQYVEVFYASATDHRMISILFDSSGVMAQVISTYNAGLLTYAGL